MKRISHFFVIFLVVILTACGISSEGYRNVNSDEAKTLIDNKKVVVLDVRTHEEFQAGHIPNALLIPLQELENKLNDLDQEESYLIVCRSGNRSAQASEILTSNRFSSIYNMTGGMNNWAYEIEN
jgi:rhodanese-related sulfurtransferase